MELGEVIRKYRKAKNLTQEEMACRLGVSGPAVNKWENGNTMPDITLLAPIARLLEVSLDTLLSFREELTAEEINEIICRLDKRLQEESYASAFQWAMEQLKEYPNCESLVWQFAVVFDAQRLIQQIPDEEGYEDKICTLYERALKSKDEGIHYNAASSLFGFYMRKEQYEKAESCLQYFSTQNPERKRKQALLFAKTGCVAQAYKAYEELLLEQYQLINSVFQGMYRLAMDEKNREKAHLIVEKQEALAKCFEMGILNQVSGSFDLAVEEQDKEKSLEKLRQILKGIKEMESFCNSSLYEHLEFRSIDESFYDNLRKELLQNLRTEERYAFLRGEDAGDECI